MNIDLLEKQLQAWIASRERRISKRPNDQFAKGERWAFMRVLKYLTEEKEEK